MNAHLGCLGARNAPASCSYSPIPAFRLVTPQIPLLAAHSLQQNKQQPLRQHKIFAAAQEAPSEAASKKQRPPDIAGRPKADDFDYPMPVVSWIACGSTYSGTKLHDFSQSQDLRVVQRTYVLVHFMFCREESTSKP